MRRPVKRERWWSPAWRVTSLLNKKLVAEGRSRVNPKRIYRIMCEAKLLLARTPEG